MVVTHAKAATDEVGGADVAADGAFSAPFRVNKLHSFDT